MRSAHSVPIFRRRSEFQRRNHALAAAFFLTGIGTLPPATADEMDAPIAPVIKVTKDARSKTPSGLPPVRSGRPETGRVTSDRDTARVKTRVFVGSNDPETLEAVPEIRDLAPVIRVQPQRSEDSRKALNPIPVPIDPKRDSLELRTRSREPRDRTAMQIPTSILETETALQTRLATLSHHGMSYGDPDTEAVTIDLRDESRAAKHAKAAENQDLAAGSKEWLMAPAESDSVTMAETQTAAGAGTAFRADEKAESLDEFIVGEPRTGVFAADMSGRLYRRRDRVAANRNPQNQSARLPSAQVASASGSTAAKTSQTRAVNPRISNPDSLSSTRADAHGSSLSQPRRTVTPHRRTPVAFQTASAYMSAKAPEPKLMADQLVPPASTGSPSDRQNSSVPDGATPETEQLPAPKSVQTADDEVFRPIQQVRIDIAPGKGVLPPNRAAERFAREGEEMHPTGFSRSEPETHFEWEAPALCHRPLFFEDVNLERHGYHVKYVQPFLSAAHFFCRLPATPYLAVSQRSRVCNYTLGHYQPGSYAPYVWYYPRPSLAGTAWEGAVIAGLILALP